MAGGMWLERNGGLDQLYGRASAAKFPQQVQEPTSPCRVEQSNATGLLSYRGKSRLFLTSVLIRTSLVLLLLIVLMPTILSHSITSFVLHELEHH